jgi:arginyl-tRNA synthetase
VRRIAVSTLKYGMLSVGTNKRVVFSVDAWTNPHGDTGAYLLYAVARTRSVVRKAAEAVDLRDIGSADGFGDPAERALLNHLLKAPGVLERAAAGSEPSVVASWLYDTARAVARFWDACPVLTAPPPLRKARLALIRATDLTMTWGLDLLGITPVNAM